MPIEFKNAILKRLPPTVVEAFLNNAELVPMRLGQIGIEMNQPITKVHFPELGLHSMVAFVDDAEVEIATVGFEGMIGIPLVLAESTTTGRVFCQMAGKSWQIASDKFLLLLDSSPIFKILCLKYINFVFEQAAKNSVCNRIHSIDERCAKWMLLCLDRADGSSFELTQQFLAQMLGVRRQSVNVAAATLQAAGMIIYSRGEITVLNREGLEECSCECYKMINGSLTRYLSWTPEVS